MHSVVCSVSKLYYWPNFFNDAMTAKHYLLVEKSFKKYSISNILAGSEDDFILYSDGLVSSADDDDGSRE
jgi:hypothetical protein